VLKRAQAALKSPAQRWLKISWSRLSNGISTSSLSGFVFSSRLDYLLNETAKMDKFKFFEDYPYGKHWAQLSDHEKQSVAKDVLLEFFDAIEIKLPGHKHRPLKVIHLSGWR
jgi:hypothetical protein